jgi:hypothetical protein
MKKKTSIKCNNIVQVIWQCTVGALFMAIALFTLGHLSVYHSGIWAIGAGSLASSTYLIFVTPHRAPARFTQLFFSYFICIFLGIVGHIILLNFHTFFWLDLITAAAVGLAIFIMSLFKLKHSCATGISVMLVLEMHNYYPIVAIFASVLLLGIIHECLKFKMKDLL